MRVSESVSIIFADLSLASCFVVCQFDLFEADLVVNPGRSFGR